MEEELKSFIKRHNCCWLINFVRFLKSIYILFRARWAEILLCAKKNLSYINRKKLIREYFNSHKVCKLQIGAGGNVLEGWLNTDFFPYAREIVALDVTKPFPFPDSSFDYIFCEHMIEHITYNEGLKMLQECRRVLKLGGKMRISTPNLQTHLGLFNETKMQIHNQYMDWIGKNWLQRQGISYNSAAFILNLIMHGWGHKFIYDFKTLSLALADSGFTGIIQVPCGSSADENFRGIERHGDTIKDIKSIKVQSGIVVDNEMNNFATLVVEAVKK